MSHVIQKSRLQKTADLWDEETMAILLKRKQDRVVPAEIFYRQLSQSLKIKL